MTSSVKRRISDLENKVLKPFKLGTTKILIEDEAEQALFDQAHFIVQSYSYSELTPNQKHIIDVAMHRMWMRALDIFSTIIGGMIHHEDPIGQMLWHSWLCYFIDEAKTGIRQRLEEDRIYDQKGKSWKQKKKEAKELYKDWKKPFRTESFEKYITEHLLKRSVEP